MNEHSANKAVLYDFDGVIVDTGSICYELSRRFVEGLEESTWTKWFEGNVHEKVAGLPIVAETVDGRTYNDHYYERLQAVPLIPKIDAFIKEMREAGYRQYIVSSAQTYMVHDFIEAHGLLTSFDRILGADVHRSKVKKFEMLRDEEQVDLSKSIFITDTLGDLREAETLAIPSIAVSWGYHNERTLENGKAKAIVHSIQELRSAIDAYF